QLPGQCDAARPITGPSGITPPRVTPPLCMGLAVLLSVRNGLARRDIEQTKRVTPPRHDRESSNGSVWPGLKCDDIPVVENSPRREKPEKTGVRLPGPRLYPRMSC